MKERSVNDIILISLFTALMIAGAFIKIPLPLVPLTFQGQFAILAGIVLGHKRGSAAVGLYVIMGLIGIPVFTQGGGIQYIFQPTFGYIIGFVVAAYICGYVSSKFKNSNLITIYAANLVGLVVIYALGIIYFYAMKNFYFGDSVKLGSFLWSFLAIPIVPDLLKCAVFTIIASRIKPFVK